MSPTDVARPSSFEARYGHPPGLFVLFFAEMWERFSYYGMRALLMLYMTKGFLGYGDAEANGKYAAYTSLVYMTPFFGGLIADRLIGQRRSVVLGGALMAAGHLLMTIEAELPFFVALSLLICGNGFFKPNISTIVGELYPAGDHRRDGGFTLFYMGINLGAALAPLVCGYVGETYGWHYGFGLATIGMMVGLAVFVADRFITQLMIMGTAVATAVGMLWMQQETLMLGVNAPIALALVIAAGVAWQALADGGVPDAAGQPKDPTVLQRSYAGLGVQTWIGIGTLLAVPLGAWLVWSVTAAEYVLNSVGLLAAGYLLYEAATSVKVERERIFVILVMMFYSMLFWAFFEQAGSSLSLFTDRNVDRVLETRVITADEVGKTVELEPTQAWLGYPFDGADVALPNAKDAGPVVMTIDRLDQLKARLKEQGKETMPIRVLDQQVGMGVATSEIPASIYQAANPTFILLFGLVFTWMWAQLGRYEPSTPVKFALGLAQLGLGFFALWFGSTQADPMGMVPQTWLIVGYLLHTTGELCLSPVGLSMVTRLSPARLVSTAMGAWFLATAFSQLLAGRIANLMAVGGHGGDEKVIPPPIETVQMYGDVFYMIGLAACVAAVTMLLLAPLLNKWSHEESLGPSKAGGH